MLKDHNAGTPVKLEPAAPRSWVKHSSTEPLRSHQNWCELCLHVNICLNIFIYGKCGYWPDGTHSTLLRLNTLYLLISSLPSRALRMPVESGGLPSNMTCFLEAEPGELDIKRCQPGILFINLTIGLAIMT